LVKHSFHPRAVARNCGSPRAAAKICAANFSRNAKAMTQSREDLRGEERRTNSATRKTVVATEIQKRRLALTGA